MKKNLSKVNMMALGSLFLLSACSEVSIEGAWVEPVPGMENMQQGFVLAPGGKASSINMATLQYESWKKENGMLILSGKSIGNRQTINFSDTLMIKNLSEQTLTLERDGMSYTYTRTTESQEEPMQQDVSQVPVKLVEGRLILGHEVCSFVADGDTADYWVIDKTGELDKQYEELTKGKKNGTSVHAILEVMDMGKSDEGFAAEYDGVYHVTGISQLSAE